MSCSIIRNKETNEVEKVLAPNGQESLLYKKLLDTPEINGNKELALHAWAYVYTDSFKNKFGDWENLNKSTVETKEGVKELFDSNPELANAVYEALGFTGKLKVSLGKELEYKDPYAKNRIKDFKKYEVLDNSGKNIGTVVIEDRGNKTVILHPELSVIGKGYGKDLYKTISSKLGVTIQEWNEGAISKSDSAKAMWDSLEKEGSAIRIFNQEDGDNFRQLTYKSEITPQQKQQAQQIYSKYLNTIFPDSKVKDVVYHGVAKGKQAYNNILENGFLTTNESNWSNSKDKKFKGVFFTDLSTATSYGVNLERELRPEEKDFVIPAILNVENLLTPKVGLVSGTVTKLRNENANVQNLGIQGEEGSEGVHQNTVVFEPEQIHVLGNKQDIEGFKKFTEEETSSKTLDENGEPLLEEDTIESMYNDLVNNSDFGEVIEEQDDTTEPELKLSEQIEAEKEPLDVKIQRFLESIGVDVKAVDEIRDSQGNFISARAKADLLNKVIEVVSGRQSMDTLTEEAAHFFVEMLGENSPLYKEMFSKITNYKIYQDVVSKYKNLARYRKADGTINFDKLKKEAVAKVISEHIFKLQQGEESDNTMSSLLNWWNKVWDYVKSFFINAEEDPFETSAEKILSADITGLNTEERFNEEYYQLVDPVTGVKEDQKNINLDNSIDPRTGQKRHIYTYKGQTAKGSVTSYYVDRWLKKIFRSDQRSELQKLIDLAKAEYGDIIHDQIQDIVKSWTDANGMKLDVQSPISPKVNSKIYNDLNKFVQSIMNQYEPGTMFMSEVKIYDQKTKIAGSIDLLVVQPNNVVDIYDWKSQEIGKTQTDIKTYKETMYRIQLENYRKILQLQYGFEKFGKIRAIPMKTSFTYKDGMPNDLREIEIGNIDPLLIPDEKNYLLPVTLRGETTGDEQLDDLIEKLNAIYDKIEKTRYTKEQTYKKREELSQIRIALRELQLKQRIGKFIDLGLVQYKKYSEMIGNNSLTGKDIQEALRILQVFQDSGVMLYDLREQYAEVLKEKKDDKALAAYEATNKKFQSMTSKVSKLIKDVEKYRDIQTEELGKQNGIVNVMQAEAPVNMARGTFSSLSNIPQKMFKLFSKLLRRAQNIRDTKFDNTIRDLKKAKKNFIKWAEAKGLSTEKAMEKILDIDEKGNWDGNFLRKYKPEFSKERKEAIDKQNLQWFLDNTDYDPDEYAEAEKKERESISSVIFAEEEKENKEIINKKMKEWIDNHKVIKEDGSINTIALSNVKNRFIKPKEKWLTDKWKELNSSGNEPLLEMYNEFQKLIRYSEGIGMLDQYSPRFIPSTYKAKLDQLAFGDVKGLFSTKGFFENLQVDSGTTYTPEIDPTDGSIINRIPVYFTKDIGVKKEDGTMDYSKKSRDLFKVFAIWAAHMYNYEAMESIEDDSLMLLEAEKNKKSLVTDTFGKISLDENGRVKSIDQNDRNSQLLEKFVNYYLYDRINGKLSDIKIYNPFNKDLENRKEISVLKSVGAAIRFFSLKTLALNPISGTSQFVGGTGNALFIAQKGVLFTKKLWANAMYKVASDKKSREALVYLNILQEGNKHKMIDELSLSSVNNLLKEDNFFAIQRLSDKGVQYPVAIAMMMDHMVNDDGKIVSIQKTVKDEFNYNTEFYNLSKEERKETLKKIEARVKELQETKSLLEIGKLDDEGHFYIPGIEKSSQTMGEFRDKIKAANKKIIGNSSREDINAIRTTMFGQAVMQFRNWMPEMIEERISGLNYDEELQTWTYGKFNSFFKDLLSTKLPKLLKAVATGYGDNAVELAKMRYQEMKRSAYERGEEFTITEGEFIDLYIGNLKSMIAEILVVTGFATAVLSIVAGAGEDRRKSGYKQYLARALKKYYNEFSFYYLPTEFTKLVKSPIPVVGLAEDMFRFTGNLTKEIAGQASGNEKWIKSAHPEKYFFRMVPVAKEAMTLGAAFDDNFRRDWDINLQTGGF